MLLNTEHPSWLAFPDVPQWASQTPRLEVSFPDRELPPHVHQVFHTDSLAEAVRNLLPQSAMQIVYWVFSLAQDGSLAEQFCTHELDASVLHPLTAQPRDVWSREDSGLWSAERKRSALFALRPQPELRSIRLCVGGNSPEECLATWLTVAGWIRTLLRIQCPKQRIPAKAPVVERPAVSPCRARVQKLVRQQVREALLRAADIETKAGPFRLRGRGHEPRVTLNPSLAATVRSIDLPMEWISGFRPNRYYPLRVFARAAAELERAHGRQVLVVQETRARLAEVPPCTQRSCDCKKGTGAK